MGAVIVDDKETEMKASATIEINKPLKEVWAYIADLRTMEKWVDGVSDVKLASQGPLAAGTAFSSKYTYQGKTYDYEYVVTEVAAPFRMSMKSTKGPFPFQGWFELQEAGKGTRCINTIYAGSDSFMTTLIFILMWPLIRMMMRKRITKELVTLKGILEK